MVSSHPLEISLPGSPVTAQLGCSTQEFLEKMMGSDEDMASHQSLCASIQEEHKTLEKISGKVERNLKPRLSCPICNKQVVYIDAHTRKFHAANIGPWLSLGFQAPAQKTAEALKMAVASNQQKNHVGDDAITAVPKECQYAETRYGGFPVLSLSLQEKLGKLTALSVSLVSQQTQEKSSTDETNWKKSENEIKEAEKVNINESPKKVKKIEMLGMNVTNKENLVVFWIKLCGNNVYSFDSSREFHGMFMVGKKVKVASVRRMVSAKLGMKKERVVLGLVGGLEELEDWQEVSQVGLAGNTLSVSILK